MQKKKPSFQVIPNYRINGASNWNESKEMPAEQGLQGQSRAKFSDLCSAFPYARSALPSYRGADPLGLNCPILT
jgi:hypothetical protein